MKPFIVRPIGLLLLFFICSGNSCEDKCNYMHNEKDKMTGEMLKITNVEEFKDPWVKVLYYRNSDSINIHLAMVREDAEDLTIPKGSNLKVQLANGESFTLNTTKEAKPDSDEVEVKTKSSSAKKKVGDFSKYVMRYHCGRENMEKISQQGFTRLQIELWDNEHIDKDLDNREKIKNTAIQARCLLGTLKEE